MAISNEEQNLKKVIMTSTQSYYIYTQYIKLSAAAFTFYHVIVNFWPHTKTLTYNSVWTLHRH